MAIAAMGELRDAKGLVTHGAHVAVGVELRNHEPAHDGGVFERLVNIVNGEPGRGVPVGQDHQARGERGPRQAGRLGRSIEVLELAEQLTEKVFFAVTR